MGGSSARSECCYRETKREICLALQLRAGTLSPVTAVDRHKETDKTARLFFVALHTFSTHTDSSFRVNVHVALGQALC